MNEFVENISKAIRCHRASYKGNRDKIESIVAMADRGAPNLEIYLYRSYVYGRSKLQLNQDEALVHSFFHICQDKFGPEGYAIQDGLIPKYYPDEWAEFVVKRDQLDLCSYREMVQSLNWENKINDKRSER